MTLLDHISGRIESLLHARHEKKTYVAHGRLSPGTVRNVLNGRNCRLSTLIALAEALDCDLVVDMHPRQAPTDEPPTAISCAR